MARGVETTREKRIERGRFNSERGSERRWSGIIRQGKECFVFLFSSFSFDSFISSHRTSCGVLTAIFAVFFFLPSPAAE
jgi:hypothetical protein